MGVFGAQARLGSSLDGRVLVFSPSANASARMLKRLSAAGIAAERYEQMSELTAALQEGAGAIILICEHDPPQGMLLLLEQALARQPEWSHIPLMVMPPERADRESDALYCLPVSARLLWSFPENVFEQILQTALQARRRQYAVRDTLDQYRSNTRKLVEAARAKDDFLAALAHELRNPLSALGSAAGLLRAEAATQATNRLASGVVDRQVKYMTRLLDDLLDVTRISLNRLELRKERCRVSNIIRAAVEAVQPLLDAKRHSLVIDLPDPGIEIHADPYRVCQVVSNLLTNAAKYTDREGNITIRIEQNAVEAIISVKDDGKGIPAESLDRIFGMFAQLDVAGGQSAGGLGIGLSLVRGIVELHGGSVRAVSAGAGMGSEFFVHLPATPQVPLEITAS
jgi:signal transduction histidine kinase